MIAQLGSCLARINLRRHRIWRVYGAVRISCTVVVLMNVYRSISKDGWSACTEPGTGIQLSCRWRFLLCFFSSPFWGRRLRQPGWCGTLLKTHTSGSAAIHPSESAIAFFLYSFIHSRRYVYIYFFTCCCCCYAKHMRNVIRECTSFYIVCWIWNANKCRRRGLFSKMSGWRTQHAEREKEVEIGAVEFDPCWQVCWKLAGDNVIKRIALSRLQYVCMDGFDT